MGKRIFLNENQAPVASGPKKGDGAVASWSKDGNGGLDDGNGGLDGDGGKGMGGRPNPRKDFGTMSLVFL